MLYKKHVSDNITINIDMVWRIGFETKSLILIFLLYNNGNNVHLWSRFCIYTEIMCEKKDRFTGITEHFTFQLSSDGGFLNRNVFFFQHWEMYFHKRHQNLEASV